MCDLQFSFQIIFIFHSVFLLYLFIYLFISFHLFIRFSPIYFSFSLAFSMLFLSLATFDMRCKRSYVLMCFQSKQQANCKRTLQVQSSLVCVQFFFIYFSLLYFSNVKTKIPIPIFFFALIILM